MSKAVKCIIISFIFLFVGISIGSFNAYNNRRVILKLKKALNQFDKKAEFFDKKTECRISYPHINISKHAETIDDSLKINIRSNISLKPFINDGYFNVFNALTNQNVYRIKLNKLIIKKLPKEKCVLLKGRDCLEFVEISLVLPSHLSGAFLISLEDEVFNDRLEPNTALTLFNLDYNCEIGIVYPDYTVLAYNAYGGNSLYKKPFPIPGEMSSSIVSEDRPSISNINLRTFYTTAIFFNEITNLGYSPAVPLTNTLMDETTDWMNLKVVLLTGHDEYWTRNLRRKIDLFVTNGGALGVFSGNTGYRILEKKNKIIRRIKHWDEEYPTELSIGLSTRFGALPAKQKIRYDRLAKAGFLSRKDLLGMKVILSSHPVFYDTNLIKGDVFGSKSSLIYHEIDGAPLIIGEDIIDYNKFPKVVPMYDGVTILNDKFQAVGVTPIASTFLEYFDHGQGPPAPQYSATFVEYKRGDGIVLNGGSVGWFKSLNDGDLLVKKVFKNSISFLLNHK